jgi:MFS family permease
VGPLIAIIAEGLLSRLSFGLIGFALPLYARHLGLSLAEVGVLTALNSAVALGLKPVVGWAADRFGLKRTYLVAISVRSLVSLAFGFASAPWQLYAIRSAHGVSTSLRDPSANALIAEHGEAKSQGETNRIASAFAWYQTAKTVAGSLSRALAGILLGLTASNFTLVFLLAFVLSVLPLLVVWRYVQEHHGATHVADSDPAHPAVRRERESVAEPGPARPGRPRISAFVGLGFLIAATAEMLHGLFPVLATEYAGLTNAQAGFIYALATLATIVAGPLFGWLSDSVSRRMVLAVRTAANTLSSVIYVVFPSFAGIAIAKTADDVGKAAFRPAWGSLMAEVSSFDRRNRARTMGWMSMGEDAGIALGPMLAGVLWGTWGIGALMGARIALAVVTEFYVLVINRNPAREAATAISPLSSPRRAGRG